MSLSLRITNSRLFPDGPVVHTPLKQCHRHGTRPPITAIASLPIPLSYVSAKICVPTGQKPQRRADPRSELWVRRKTDQIRRLGPFGETAQPVFPLRSGRIRSRRPAVICAGNTDANARASVVTWRIKYTAAWIATVFHRPADQAPKYAAVTVQPSKLFRRAGSCRLTRPQITSENRLEVRLGRLDLVQAAGWGVCPSY